MALLNPIGIASEGSESAFMHAISDLQFSSDSTAARHFQAVVTSARAAHAQPPVPSEGVAKQGRRASEPKWRTKLASMRRAEIGNFAQSPVEAQVLCCGRPGLCNSRTLVLPPLRPRAVAQVNKRMLRALGGVAA